MLVEEAGFEHESHADWTAITVAAGGYGQRATFYV